MKVLGIETSHGAGRLALVGPGEPPREGEDLPGNRHSASLIRLLDELLERAGWRKEDLDLIGVGTGPGSFTGLRVGLALAGGLARGLDVPLYGVGSFAAVAAGVAEAEEVSVVADARRGRLYAARFRKEAAWVEALRGPEIVPVEEIGDYVRGSLAVSPDAERLKRELPGFEAVPCRPSPLAVAGRALALAEAGISLPPEAALPVYLGTGPYRRKTG